MTKSEKARMFFKISLKSFGMLLLFSIAYYTVLFFVMYLSNFTMVKIQYRYFICLGLASLIAIYLYFLVAMGESAKLTVSKKYDSSIVILSHILGHILFVLLAFLFKDYPLATIISYLFGVATLPIQLMGSIFWGSLIAVVPLLMVKICGILCGHYRILKEKPYLDKSTSEYEEQPQHSWRDSLK